MPDVNVLSDDVMGGDGSPSAPDGNKGCGRGDRRGVGRGGGRDGREYGSGGGRGGREYSRVGSQEEGGSCGDTGARDRGRNENKDDMASSADLAAFRMVGEYVAAVYNSEVFLAVVEGEDPDEEMPGYTLLKYLEKKSENQYIWGKLDLLHTADEDILCRVQAPFPVNNRCLGLNSDDFKIVKELTRTMVYLHLSIWIFITF